jgi:hypothetical protein
VIEAALVAFSLLAAVALVFAMTRGARAVGLGVMLTLATAVGLGVGAARRPEPVLPRERPSPRPASESAYVSSAACLPCHASQHASFGRTFHRTMTQDATSSTVKALAAGTEHPVLGRTIRLEPRGSEVWATLPDPDLVARDPNAFATAKEQTRRVVLTTGSHHEQTYWVKGQREGELRLVPIVYLIDEGRVIPRREAFLTPPDAPLGPARWNSNCIACHAVAGEPGHDEKRDSFQTRAAELGIACEACHGPGLEHVQKHRDPLERYALRRRDEAAAKRDEPTVPDKTIVHPGKLVPERSAAVCGQCHSYAFPKNEDAFWTSGYARSFRPGDLLQDSRTLLLRDVPGQPQIDREPDSLFWADGTIRVGGREYNGLVASPCYLRGKGEHQMTCLSCHSMHKGDPDGQLAPSVQANASCTQSACHARVRPHSHHAAGSPGDACVACHMPKTSYALFHGARSHTISSPSVMRTLETGEPTACNLCHLDRTLAWTSATMSAWFGAPATQVPEPRASVAEGAWLALRGDAAMRVIVAAALGTRDAQAAAALAPAALLPELEADPYAAVRIVAVRSRKAAAGDGHSEGSATPISKATLDALLLASPGVPDEKRRQSHRAARDLRPITIAE